MYEILLQGPLLLLPSIQAEISEATTNKFERERERERESNLCWALTSLASIEAQDEAQDMREIGKKGAKRIWGLTETELASTVKSHLYVFEIKL